MRYSSAWFETKQGSNLLHMPSSLYYKAKAFLEVYLISNGGREPELTEYWDLKKAIEKIKGAQYRPKQPAMYTTERKLQTQKTLCMRIQLCQALLSNSLSVTYDINAKYSLIANCETLTGEIINVLVSHNHDCSIAVIVFKYASGKHTGSALTDGETKTLTKKIRKQCS